MRTVTLAVDHDRRWLVLVPETRRERMRGLRGRPALPPGGALLLQRCRAVHTFGMRFPILVAFLDEGLRVLRTREVPPGRVARPRRGARHVLELPAGSPVREGDRFRTGVYTLWAVPPGRAEAG